MVSLYKPADVSGAGIALRKTRRLGGSRNLRLRRRSAPLTVVRALQCRATPMSYVYFALRSPTREFSVAPFRTRHFASDHTKCLVRFPGRPARQDFRCRHLQAIRRSLIPASPYPSSLHTVRVSRARAPRIHAGSLRLGDQAYCCDADGVTRLRNHSASPSFARRRVLRLQHRDDAAAIPPHASEYWR